MKSKKMKSNQMYCVKCKCPVSSKTKPILKSMKNGRVAWTGKCACGCKLFRITRMHKSKSKSKSKKRSDGRRKKSKRKSRAKSRK
jgi:hypothetical protein